MSDLSQVGPRAGLRVATWNILHGQQIPPQSGPGAAASAEGTDVDDGADNLATLIEFVAGEISADVIGLQEVDYLQPRSGNKKQVQEIARLLGNWHWGFAATVHGTPGEKWRKHHDHETKFLFSTENLESPEHPQYGIGLISKIEVKRWHVLELGRSRIGMPLLVPAENEKTGKPRARFIYVKDEPRVALAAELASGVTIAVTHLSFVPMVNLWQLWRAKRWLSRLPGTHILLGDFNIPILGLVASKKWRSLNAAKSYPSWGAKIKFDYIIADNVKAATAVEVPASGVSDHLPLVVDVIIERQESA